MLGSVFHHSFRDGSHLPSHVLRLTSHISRLTSHLSRLTSHVLRLTSHVSRLSPRVKHLVRRPEIFAVDMRVDLCGREIGVSQHFLHGAKVGATLE